MESLTTVTPQTARCSFCTGSGRCNKCDGTGDREVRSGWFRRRCRVHCWACDGSGACGLCKGDGRVEAV